MKRIEARMEKMADVVLKNEREKELQEEKIFLRQIEIKEKQEAERERVKRTTATNELRKTREIIKQQVEEKKRLKLQQQQHETEIMRKMVEAEKQKIDKLKAQEETHKRKEKEQADFLLLQMRKGREGDEASKMNSQELLYNKQILDQIPSDIW